MIDTFNRFLAPLRTRVANMVSRAVVKLVDDSKKMQLLQVDLLEGETRDELEHFQGYGFNSVPLAGAEGVAVFVGGRRDHGIVIAVDDRRYRIRNLESGEVAMYTDQGDSIVIKRGGTIEVTAATKVIVGAPLVELAGNTNPVAKGDSLNTAISTLATAIGSAVGGITPGPTTTGGGPAAALITTAVTAFTASATAALSTKVKVG